MILSPQHENEVFRVADVDGDILSILHRDPVPVGEPCPGCGDPHGDEGMTVLAITANVHPSLPPMTLHVVLDDPEVASLLAALAPHVYGTKVD